MVRRHRVIMIGLGAWLAASWCSGAEVSLTTDAATAYANEPLFVRVTVEGFKECDPPEFPSSAAYSVRSAGTVQERSSLTIVNGRKTMVRSRIYGFELTPRQVGELVIPPVRVLVDGQPLETEPVKFTVQPSDADQLFWLEVTGGRNRLYVGQRVKLTLSIWVKPARHGNQVLDANTMGRWLQMTDESVRPFGPPVRIAERQRTAGQTEETYHVYELTADFVAERPGPLRFDNIEVGITYPGRGSGRQLRARLNAPVAEVLPVPMEGRPADYGGAVGLFDIEVRAAPTRVRVGDPIELSIEVFGDGPVESLPPPLLGANRPLNEDFRVPVEKLAGEVRNARRRFSVTIRPTRDSVAAIPAIEYPYFDPDAERFVVARSDPVPLTVAPAAEAAPPQVPAVTAHPGASPGALQPLDGLHDIETSEAALLATTQPLGAGLVTAVALLPAAVFLVTWGVTAFVQRHTADPRRQRRRAARRTARQHILRVRAQTPADLAREVAAALAGYLADRSGEPPARLTGPAALEFLRGRGVASEAIDRWAAVIGRCEEATFAGGAPADAEALVQQALDCVATLERQRL